MDVKRQTYFDYLLGRQQREVLALEFVIMGDWSEREGINFEFGMDFEFRVIQTWDRVVMVMVVVRVGV